jgi:hypothetical protein
VNLDEGDAYDLDLATASLLADNKDIHMLLNVLTKQLAGARGDRLVVERKGGLLHRSEEIKSLAVTVAKDEFTAVPHGGGVECTIGHASGGIRIRSEQVDISEWLHRLLNGLQTEAEHSQNARAALENIVIGGTS